MTVSRVGTDGDDHPTSPRRTHLLCEFSGHGDESRFAGAPTSKADTTRFSAHALTALHPTAVVKERDCVSPPKLRPTFPMSVEVRGRRCPQDPAGPRRSVPLSMTRYQQVGPQRARLGRRAVRFGSSTSLSDNRTGVLLAVTPALNSEPGLPARGSDHASGDAHLLTGRGSRRRSSDGSGSPMPVARVMRRPERAVAFSWTGRCDEGS